MIFYWVHTSAILSFNFPSLLSNGGVSCSESELRLKPPNLVVIPASITEHWVPVVAGRVFTFVASLDWIMDTVGGLAWGTLQNCFFMDTCGPTLDSAGNGLLAIGFIIINQQVDKQQYGFGEKQHGWCDSIQVPTLEIVTGLAKQLVPCQIRAACPHHHWCSQRLSCWLYWSSLCWKLT